MKRLIKKSINMSPDSGPNVKPIQCDCGAPVDNNSQYCPYCGKQYPTIKKKLKSQDFNNAYSYNIRA